MDRQTMFDRVYRHFVIDRASPSVVFTCGTVQCRYRGPNGERCALGLLIPDDAYEPTMEGTLALGLLDNKLCARLGIDIDDVDFVDELQGAHDHSVDAGAGFHDDLESKLRHIAARYDLTVPS